MLIGAVTTLIVVVAVFLSYNANNGLPFTPTYDIKVQLPEASGLQKGNQVRIGGERVGVISALSPYQDPKTGRVTAIISLKLEKTVEPLPANTNRARAIGLDDRSEVPVARTRSLRVRKLKAGETIPVSQTREPVDIDQFFDMFDEKTSASQPGEPDELRQWLRRARDRPQRNDRDLAALGYERDPRLHNLASPKTGFGQLFVAFDRIAKEVAPVASEQAALYSNLDTFFTAWASVAPSLEQAIVGGPPALHQATHSLPFEAEFVNKSADFMRLLRPSAKILTTVAATARTRL